MAPGCQEKAMPLYAPPATANPVKLPARSVVILCYHSLGEKPDSPYDIDSAEFRDQMNFIAQNQYHVLSLSQVVAMLKDKQPIPDSAVVITFDDGYETVYTNAWPVLRRLGFPFTIFIYTNFVGSASFSLTWLQLKELTEAGVEIGSHSVHHPYLPIPGRRNDWDYRALVMAELTDSRKIIGEKTGRFPDYFAYPFGAYDDSIAAWTRAAGYEACFTVDGGVIDNHSDRSFLNRTMITRAISRAQFKNILNLRCIDLAYLHPSPGEEIDRYAGSQISALLKDVKKLRANSIDAWVTGAQGRPLIDTLRGRMIFRLTGNLSPGFHEVVVVAQDTAGHDCQARWMFSVR
jgi:peptidoglycan/xylan/chitin deacetylase (PgdA/CDA1 family)